MSACNLMILQGGGPTTVLNASLASIVEEAIRQPGIDRIYGALSGMRGLAHDAVANLSGLVPDEIHAMRDSPGAALGSSRFKPTEEDMERSIALLRRMGIRHLVFMGGNGTMAGASIVAQACRSAAYDVQIMGVPKTIDNDIAATDRCPGFASAARYAAQSTLDLSMDIRSLPQPVSIFETLGRDVGWLAAASTLAKTLPEDAPHLVYLPEMPFYTERFLGDLDAVVTRHAWAVVVVSEGICDASGKPVFEQHLPAREGVPNRPLIGGVAQYLSGVVAQHLGLRCRSEKPGLIGRSCMAHRSAQDLADAELVGREAVRALVRGETDQMVALRPLSEPTGKAFELVPLTLAAGPRRAIPAAWLSDSDLKVGDAFQAYAAPLVGKLARYPQMLRGI